MPSGLNVAIYLLRPAKNKRSAARLNSGNKKPAQGGFIFYQQRLTAQAITFIAIVITTDN